MSRKLRDCKSHPPSRQDSCSQDSQITHCTIFPLSLKGEGGAPGEWGWGVGRWGTPHIHTIKSTRQTNKQNQKNPTKMRAGGRLLSSRHQLLLEMLSWQPQWRGAGHSLGSSKGSCQSTYAAQEEGCGSQGQRPVTDSVRT